MEVIYIFIYTYTHIVFVYIICNLIVSIKRVKSVILRGELREGKTNVRKLIISFLYLLKKLEREGVRSPL